LGVSGRNAPHEAPIADSDAVCVRGEADAASTDALLCRPAKLTGRWDLRCRGVSTEGEHPECCDATCALIEACLSGDVAARPTAAQLVATLEGLQGDAAEPESRPVSAQLVAALGQLQGDAADSSTKPIPVQHLSAESAVGSPPPAEAVTHGF
jgi:hypothetical protein